MKAKSGIMAVCVFFLMIASVQATTLFYSGRITSVEINIHNRPNLSPIPDHPLYNSLGSSFSGVLNYAYDPSEDTVYDYYPDDPSIGVYHGKETSIDEPLFDNTVYFDGYKVTGWGSFPETKIITQADSSSAVFTYEDSILLTKPDGIEYSSFHDFWLSLIKTDGIFEDDSLFPSDGLNYGLFNSGEWGIELDDISGSIFPLSDGMGSSVRMIGSIDNLFTATPVPEPSTIVLLGIGLIGVTAYARRNIRQSRKKV